MNDISAPGSSGHRQAAAPMRRSVALVMLMGALSASSAVGQVPASATPPPPPAAAQSDSVDPAVNTSSAASPPARPAARPATQAAPATGGRRAMDRVDLDASQITGNRELPRVLYIVPWKRSDLGDLTGKPVNSLLDEVLAPVDRDVFKRETRYFDALATGPAPASGGNAAAPAADAPARTMPTVPAAPSGTGDSVRDGSQPVTPPGT